MCRLFGFRSVLNSGVHSSLISAENALSGQSRRHPDGWGLAYYLDQSPHVIKSIGMADTDELFKKVSGIVSSQTVIAHVRKATQGKLCHMNTHPFQHGKWTFAHNGNIKDFSQKKQDLLDLISPSQRRWCLGDTDSELFFHFLMDRMRQENLIDRPALCSKHLSDLLRESIRAFLNVAGPLSVRDVGQDDENYLTFVLTNGKSMIAMNGGLTLKYSTSKKKCPERDTCASFQAICEREAIVGEKINHLILSSEPLQGENVWHSTELGDIISVDEEMGLFRTKLHVA